MDREDCLRSRTDLRGDVGRIEVQRLVDLGEHRERARVDDRGDRCHERESGDDDLVTGPDAQALEGRPDGAGSRIDPDGETNPGERGDTVLERSHLGPEVRIVLLPVPAEALVAKDVEHFRDFVLADEPESRTWHLFTTSQADGASVWAF